MEAKVNQTIELIEANKGASIDEIKEIEEEMKRLKIM